MSEVPLFAKIRFLMGLHVSYLSYERGIPVMVGDEQDLLADRTSWSCDLAASHMPNIGSA